MPIYSQHAPHSTYKEDRYRWKDRKTERSLPPSLPPCLPVSWATEYIRPFTPSPPNSLSRQRGKTDRPTSREGGREREGGTVLLCNQYIMAGSGVGSLPALRAHRRPPVSRPSPERGTHTSTTDKAGSSQPPSQHTVCLSVCPDRQTKGREGGRERQRGANGAGTDEREHSC